MFFHRKNKNMQKWLRTKNTNRNCITSGKMCCGCWNCCWRILNNVNLLWVLSRRNIDVGNENFLSRGDRMCRRLWTNVNEKILNTPIDFQWDLPSSRDFESACGEIHERFSISMIFIPQSTIDILQAASKRFPLSKNGQITATKVCLTRVAFWRERNHNKLSLQRTRHGVLCSLLVKEPQKTDGGFVIFWCFPMILQNVLGI
jgi:hypothetical protein